MNDLESLCESIEKYCLDSNVDCKREYLFLNKIELKVKIWCDEKNIGQENPSFDNKLYNRLFICFINLLCKIRDTSDEKTKELAEEFLFTSTDISIYRFLNLKFNQNTKVLEEEIRFDNNYCSWTLIERPNYIESKMNKGNVRVTAYLKPGQYGINVSKMGFIQQHEKEIVFPFYEDSISKIDIFYYENDCEYIETIYHNDCINSK